MSVTQPTPLNAALLYRTHDPLNFKHLASTLNMILEPSEIAFSVVDERPGQAAVLSSRTLHVAITANDASNTSSNLQNRLCTETNASITQNPARKLATHKRAIEVVVGIGPLPDGRDENVPSDTDMLPLLAQMVVNHLLNMHPAQAVYWGAHNQIMSPHDFFAMINAPMGALDVQGPPAPPSISKRSDGMPVRSPHPEPLINPSPNLIRSERVKGQDNAKGQLLQTLSDKTPSFIAGHLEKEGDQPLAVLAKQMRAHVDKARNGPKAPFVLSAATMLVSPVIGALLLIYNVSGGARLRQTALFACIAAAVTLAANLSDTKTENATAAVPAIPSTTSQL